MRAGQNVPVLFRMNASASPCLGCGPSAVPIPGACIEQETSNFISHIGIREMSDHF